MNKGSKYKSGQRPTFRIWDNEKNDWFEPTYEGWDEKIEELLLSPTGDLTMRTFTDFKHESVFPERFEIVLDEPQKISWRKAISVLEHHFQCEIPRNLDNVVKGYREMSGILNTVEFELSKRNSELTAKDFIFKALESKKHKVKVPAYVAEWIERNKSGDVQLIIILKYFGQWYEMNENENLNDEICKWVIENSETFMRAWLDGYEVEEEPKWKIINDQKYCLTSIEAGYGNSLHWAFDSTKKKPILFDNEKTALYTAYITGGKVEKVLVR